ncbi:hypothetical protein D3C87_1805810 [compost metagenome]
MRVRKAIVSSNRLRPAYGSQISEHFGGEYWPLYAHFARISLPGKLDVPAQGLCEDGAFDK